MYESHLIGAYSNGIGYGNISMKASADTFYISGTATGRLEALEEKHYPLVNSWDINDNSLLCTGRINASAESLSHAVIYDSLPDVGAVIHIHHKGMWDKYLNEILTTSPNVLYGTPEMAKEIEQIVSTVKANQDPILVMGGHEEGIIVWGRTIDEAGKIVMNYYNSFLEQ
jgi:L-ribulose-5-phosphate 4-epimerase